MAIVYWTLAGSAPENGLKGDTSREGGASEEEPGEKKTEQESSEERKSLEKEMADLEDKVCCFYHVIHSCVVESTVGVTSTCTASRIGCAHGFHQGSCVAKNLDYNVFS